MFMTAVHLGIDFDHFRLTFVDGLPAGFLAFPDLYGAIGHYVPWKVVCWEHERLCDCLQGRAYTGRCGIVEV